MKSINLYIFIYSSFILLSILSCNSSKISYFIGQNRLENAYANLTPSLSNYKIDHICGTSFKNKDNGQLFQDVENLTLNCDSTFIWKHNSCIQEDISFGKWTVMNNKVILKSNNKLKRKIAKQNKKSNKVYFGKYVDFDNSTIFIKDSVIIWEQKIITDTLYRY